MPGVPMLVVSALALGVSALVAEAAELPSRAKKTKPPENAQALQKCNVGGLAGVVAANGVCVRMSGSISAGFGATQIK